ncbi:MAG: hypothetical protein FWC41_07005 [Firmicutes bacterium]|nr:hypothetical protein [Bacillota bacterium]
MKNEIIYGVTKEILSDCKEKSIDVRLFGSVALLFLDNSKFELIGNCREEIADIDIIVKPNHIVALENYFISRSYEMNRKIKMLYGNTRRGFYTENNISIDVFIGNITLCQKISILDRFYFCYPTLTPTDLFLTKIQKINLSESDVFDIDFIFEYGIDFQYIIDLTSNKWNWWKTLITNITFLLKENISEKNKKLLTDLLYEINSVEKTFIWKVRNIIGERMQWHNNVE